MRWMLAAALVLAPSAARAQPCAANDPTAPCHQRDETGSIAPFAYPKFVRTLVGVGAVPHLSGAFAIVTGEVGGHPLTGALATGFSFSSATDFGGHFTVVTPGLFARLDLTYLFLTGMWAVPPDDRFPIRLQLGSRLGVDLSDSFQPRRDAHGVPSYSLIRPSLETTFDAEVVVDRKRHYTVIVRGAFDTSADLSELFRWSVSAGLGYGWGRD